MIQRVLVSMLVNSGELIALLEEWKKCRVGAKCLNSQRPDKKSYLKVQGTWQAHNCYCRYQMHSISQLVCCL